MREHTVLAGPSNVFCTVGVVYCNWFPSLVQVEVFSESDSLGIKFRLSGMACVERRHPTVKHYRCKDTAPIGTAHVYYCTILCSLITIHVSRQLRSSNEVLLDVTRICQITIPIVTRDPV